MKLLSKPIPLIYGRGNQDVFFSGKFEHLQNELRKRLLLYSLIKGRQMLVIDLSWLAYQ